MTFHWLMIDAGFKSEEELANFFDVTTKTVNNWKRKKLPKPVFLCLELMAGNLNGLGKPWNGFRLTSECIESPEGDFIYAYEVRAIRYVYQAAGIDRAKICNMLKHQTPITGSNRYQHKPELQIVKRNSKFSQFQQMPNANLQ